MTDSLVLPDNPNTLVVCVARFGDTLLITPVLQALKERWPQGKLTVFAHPARREVLQDLPFIDHLGDITKQRAPWLGHWVGRRFDLALVYGNDVALFRYARRVALNVIGFASENPLCRRSMSIGVPRPTGPTTATAERALLLGPLGVSPKNFHLRYVVSPSEAVAAERLVEQRGWQHKRLIGLQLQSFPSKAYRDWPPDYFAELTTALLVRYTDIQVVLLGGSESSELAAMLAERLGERVTSLAGVFSMRQNAALIARLALYVGVDTGPTHLAGALDVPMVAMYHCFHPGYLLAPQSHSALTVIEHPASKPNRGASMGDIPVALVFRAACAYLDKE